MIRLRYAIDYMLQKRINYGRNPGFTILLLYVTKHTHLLSTDYCSDLDNCCNKNLRLEKKTRKAPYKHIDMIFELFYLLW